MVQLVSQLEPRWLHGREVHVAHDAQDAHDTLHPTLRSCLFASLLYFMHSDNIPVRLLLTKSSTTMLRMGISIRLTDEIPSVAISLMFSY